MSFETIEQRVSYGVGRQLGDQLRNNPFKEFEPAIELFVAKASEKDIDILISVPNYDGQSPAHDPAIESLAGALDGVRRGMNDLDETLQPRLQGVAIFSDNALNTADWQLYRQKWLQ